MMVRAVGRGRQLWEALAVVLVAVTPIVWMPLLDFYHPQDILAVGLILAGMACALRRQWIAAGALLALAVLSQQFALLVLLPLLIVAPTSDRWKLLAASATTWMCIAVPVVVLSSGRALSSLFLGTGDSFDFGGTVLWETGLRGHALTLLSRIVPIVVALVIAWTGRRRKGDRMMEPVPFVSLMALTMSMRLVFEQGLIGYKFLALSVGLILLAIVRGRVPGYLIVWLALASLAFYPIPYGLDVNARSWGGSAVTGLETAFIVLALAIVVFDVVHRRVRWYWVLGLVLALAAFAEWPPVQETQRAPFPLWLWQVILVGSGVAMAAAPLVTFLRRDEVAPLAVEPA
jgi:hypothetical protein